SCSILTNGNRRSLMLKRSELAPRIVCAAVAALVIYRLALFVVHINPLYHVNIPALPSLSAAAAGTGTNSASAPAKSGSNAVPHALASKGTNGAVQTTNVAFRSTNMVGRATNAIAQATNVVALNTNTVAQGTNVITQATNLVAHTTNSTGKVTNSSPELLAGKSGPNAGRSPELSRMGMMPPRGVPGMAKPGPELPPEIQARLDRVIDSEIL